MMTTQFIRRIAYSTYETAEGLKEQIALAKRMHCDRVMLFNSRGHIEPAHLDRDEVLRRAVVMRTAAAEFRAAGIGVGVNNLATIGMNFSPPRKHRLPFQNLIDFDGRAFTETFCPLDEEFQRYLEFIYAAWTRVGGDEVWVDDDFRYKDNAAQCFCPLHLAAFGKITARRWSRRDVVEAVTMPGLRPNERALQWGSLQRDGLLAAARAIARGVHGVNAKCRIGFMGIGGSVAFYGSDYLGEVCRILNPSRPPLIRPEYGSMNDESRVGWSAYTPLWASRRAFGKRFLAWPELETWPLTGYNHGPKVVQQKLAWGAVHGFHSSTVSVNSSPSMLKIVERAKEQVRAISAVVEEKGLRPIGVSLELSENCTGLRTGFGPLSLGHLPPILLARLGLPLWPDGGRGRILTGNSPLVRERDLKDFARQGMVVDRPAFDTLCAMGRKDITGGATSRPMGGIPVPERYTDDARNGSAAGKVMSMEMAIVVRPSLEGFDLPASGGFTVLSEFEDSDGTTLSPAAWAREWAGGRLAVLPFDLNEPASANAILNTDRKAQLETCLEWATRAPLPVQVAGACDLAVVYRESAKPKGVVLGLANFALDDANEIVLRLPAFSRKKQVSVQMLDSSSKWRSGTVKVGEDGTLTLKGRFGVPSMEVRLYRLT